MTALARYWAGLRVSVSFTPAVPWDAAEVTDLWRRAGAMNLGAEEPTEADVAAAIDRGTTQFWLISASDRHGDYGMSGFLGVGVSNGSVKLQTFALTCPVLGKTVEYEVLGHLARVGKQHRCSSLVFLLHPTRRNDLAVSFFRQVAGRWCVEGAGGLQFEIPIAEVERIATERTAADRPSSSGNGARRPPTPFVLQDFVGRRWRSVPGQDRSAILGRIARELRNADDLQRVCGEPMAATRTTEYVPPRDLIERALASIWAEILRVDQVGIHDHFFALGGHSLLATQVASRLHDVFSVPASVRTIFERPTVAELATELAGAWDRARIEEAASLYLRVSTLSEDELDELLDSYNPNDG